VSFFVEPEALRYKLFATALTFLQFLRLQATISQSHDLGVFFCTTLVNHVGQNISMKRTRGQMQFVSCLGLVLDFGKSEGSGLTVLTEFLRVRQSSVVVLVEWCLGNLEVGYMSLYKSFPIRESGVNQEQLHMNADILLHQLQ
jgi:hypothetical protein